MKSSEKIRENFKDVCSKKFSQLAKKRLSYITGITLLSVIAGVIFLGMTIVALSMKAFSGFIMWSYGVGFASAIFFPFFAGLKSSYKKYYKRIVIELLNVFAKDSLLYPKKHFNIKEFASDSKLFPAPTNFINSESTEGWIDNILFKLTYAQLHRVYKRNSGKIRKYKVFEGTIARVKFKKQFKSDVVILPDPQGIFGIIENWKKSAVYPGLEEIMLKYTDFERLFTMFGYSNKKTELMINEDLIRCITQFSDVNQVEIFLSFIKDEMYIGLSGVKIPFYFRIIAPIPSEDTIIRYFENIGLILDLVELLNNSSIYWKK